MRSNRGFSLLEVLIATTIFAGAIMVINNIWSGNALRIRKARQMNEVTFLLQRKMTEIEIEYAGKPIREIPEQDGGDFGKDFVGYQWLMEARDFEMPDLSATLGGEGGNELLGVMIKTMTEFINKTVKEVKLTVVYQHPNGKAKPLTYSIATLFVDYEQDLAIPGLAGGSDEDDGNDGEDE